MRCELVTRGLEPGADGAQGWSFGVVAGAPCSIREATTEKCRPRQLRKKYARSASKPMRAARRMLARRVRHWHEARLVMVPDAGHSAMEPGTRAALVGGMDRFRDQA